MAEKVPLQHDHGIPLGKLANRDPVGFGQLLAVAALRHPEVAEGGRHLHVHAEFVSPGKGGALRALA